MTSADGSRFVDANVLVYAALRDDPRYAVCKTLLQGGGGGLLSLSPQILAEFYSTVTSPKRVSAPYSPLEAVEFIETLLAYEHVVVVSIPSDVPGRWMSLLKIKDVRGPQVFDLQIAATMLAHGIKELLTFNGMDFRNITEIHAVERNRHRRIPDSAVHLIQRGHRRDALWHSEAARRPTGPLLEEVAPPPTLGRWPP